MKKMFSILCLLAVAVIASAQSSTAVLSHNGEIKTFYGEYALINAHKQAVAGDVITLSSGQFKGGYIRKPITVRGMGNDIQFGGDTFNIEPTIITSAINVQCENADSTHCVTLEGLKITSLHVQMSNKVDVQLVKCNLTGIYADGPSNLYITQCFLYGRLNFSNMGYSGGITAVSSYIGDAELVYVDNSKEDYEEGQKVFQNCLIGICSMQNTNTLIKNSVVYRSPTITGSLSLNNALIYNSLIAKGSGSSAISGYDNSSQFHDYLVENNISSYLKDGTLFELTDDAKTLYLGSDGKQVGIYGGVLPFNPVPTYPRITTFNVAPQTTADGKLSIDIVVK